MFYSVEINGVHMMERHRMALQDMHCVQPPEPRRTLIDLPGANGKADLSEFQTGYPLYDSRKITMTFGAGFSNDEWPVRYSEVQTAFHNREVRLVFDDDPHYYYHGRASVVGYGRSRSLGTLTITVDADPYKYELESSLDDWKWDIFPFEDGVIRDYKGIRVDGTATVTVVGSPMPVIPTITVDADMDVTVDGQAHHLRPGQNKLYGAPIMDREYAYAFTGHGTASIEYRGGRL